MKFAVVLEPTDTGYSAWVPDLPGCVGAGSTLDEARANIESAIPFHIDGLRRNGDVVPDSVSIVEVVDVDVKTPA